MESPQTVVPIVIVEAHHHVLEHIHAVLRRKLLRRYNQRTSGRAMTMTMKPGGGGSTLESSISNKFNKGFPDNHSSLLSEKVPMIVVGEASTCMVNRDLETAEISIDRIHTISQLPSKGSAVHEKESSSSAAAAAPVEADAVETDAAVHDDDSVSWTLVNFDSHPDMACVRSIPVSAVFNPRKSFTIPDDPTTTTTTTTTIIELPFIEKDESSGNTLNLYEMLDTSVSGIAEWILPLVLAANLNTVYWIRSSWANQFDDGHYTFHVGAVTRNTTVDKISHYLDLPEDSRMKVDLNHPYYIEDSSVVEGESLHMKKSLSFIVSQALPPDHHDHHQQQQPPQQQQHSMGGNNDNQLNQESTHIYGLNQARKQDLQTDSRMWCLSVDLDYFYCLNPFVSDLEVIDKPFTTSLLKATNETKFRRTMATQLLIDYDMKQEYETEYHRFISLLTSFFQDIGNISEQFIIGQGNNYCLESYIKEKLHSYTFAQMYEKPDNGIELWNHVVDNLLHIEGFHSSFPFRKQLSITIIQALPCFFLPHHPEPFSESEYHRRIRFLGDTIRHSEFNQRPPFLVVISRSSVDGFTPENLVNTLQEDVLSEIHDIYCNCSRNFENQWVINSDKCQCCIIYDYGEYEGSQIDTSKIVSKH